MATGGGAVCCTRAAIRSRRSSCHQPVYLPWRWWTSTHAPRAIVGSQRDFGDSGRGALCSSAQRRLRASTCRTVGVISRLRQESQWTRAHCLPAARSATLLIWHIQTQALSCTNSCPRAHRRGRCHPRRARARRSGLIPGPRMGRASPQTSRRTSVVCAAPAEAVTIAGASRDTSRGSGASATRRE